jgi:hypothetical protein
MVHGKDDQRLLEKTNPIYSFCVLRAAYCESGVEKTKPILKSKKLMQRQLLQRIMEKKADYEQAENRANIMVYGS